MYVYIQEIKTKTPSKGSRKSIEVIREGRLINGEKKWVYGFKNSKECFKRPIKLKYKVMIAHSYREGGKVKKLSVSLGQFGYYDRFDGYPFECWNVKKKLEEKGIPCEGDVESLVYEKVDVIEERIMEEIKQTEEYIVRNKLDTIERNYYEACSKFRQEYGEDGYSCFYDVFGNLKEPILFEIYKGEWQKRKIEQEEYQQRSREEAYKRFFGEGGNSSQSIGGNSNNFSQEELELVREVISAGYKKVATKLHPDRGGDEKKMKLLNNINEKLKVIYI
ncbi:MAG: hypothetical protein K2G70_02385 [Turicibacter sp.]|nr:hypothetical protein [Turicibacter sp.]